MRQYHIATRYYWHRGSRIEAVQYHSEFGRTFDGVVLSGVSGHFERVAAIGADATLADGPVDTSLQTRPTITSALRVSRRVQLRWVRDQLEGLSRAKALGLGMMREGKRRDIRAQLNFRRVISNSEEISSTNYLRLWV